MNRFISFCIALVINMIIAYLSDYYTIYNAFGLSVGMAIFNPVKWLAGDGE